MSRLNIPPGRCGQMDEMKKCKDCRYRVVNGGEGACPYMNAGDECPYGKEKADDTL
ncbi:MAG: hypothetical protein WC528_04250 [Patescibacteria group bacterium]